MGLIPRLESMRDFCSDSDVDAFRRLGCVGLAAELRPQESLPELCEGLIRSLSARINAGAVGDYFTPSSAGRRLCPRRHGDRMSLSLQV